MAEANIKAGDYSILSDMVIDGVMHKEVWAGMSSNWYQSPMKICCERDEKIVRATYGKVLFQQYVKQHLKSQCLEALFGTSLFPDFSAKKLIAYSKTFSD